METKEKLKIDLRDSLVERNTTRTLSIRSITSAITIEEKKNGNELTEEDIYQVIRTLIKQRKQSIEFYDKLGRLEMKQAEEAEMIIINSYLPIQASEDVVKKI